MKCFIGAATVLLVTWLGVTSGATSSSVNTQASSAIVALKNQITKDITQEQGEIAALRSHVSGSVRQEQVQINAIKHLVAELGRFIPFTVAMDYCVLHGGGITSFVPTVVSGNGVISCSAGMFVSAVPGS